MNKEQGQFLKYFLEKTADHKKDEAESFLGDMFKKIEKGAFDAEAMAKHAPKMLEMIKDEHLDDVKDVVDNFMKNFGKDK